MVEDMKIRILLLFFIFGASSVSAAEPLDIVANEIAWPVKAAYAANGLKMGTVIINEIAWMGTGASYNDEWIELYNNAVLPVNLQGWVLQADDGAPRINLSGIIPSGSFYLLERTSDETVPDIDASQIYKGALDNGGELLELYDNWGNLIDSVNCSPAWFAGDNATKQTMERKNARLPGSTADNWATSHNVHGTPNSENSVVNLNPGLLPQQSSATPEQNLPEGINYPEGIIINEILPSPAGSDSEGEWIEFFNQNDFGTEISGWKIQDEFGNTNTYEFPERTSIGPKAFLVIDILTTKITLNNSRDSLILSRPNQAISDRVEYSNAPEGQSYNRGELGWFWNEILTPGTPNAMPSPARENQSQNSITGQETRHNPGAGQNLLAVEDAGIIPEEILKPERHIVIIGLATAILSGILILMLGLKMTNTRYN